MKSIFALAIAIVVPCMTCMATEPGTNELQQHITALADADNMGREMCKKVRDIGMNLCCMGDAPVKSLAELLESESRHTRWAATVVLAMIGPEAADAVPTLEHVLNNQEEEVRVRVRAARAIAEITGRNVFDMYKKISDLEEQIVAGTRLLNARAQSEELWNQYLDGSLEENWHPYRVADNTLGPEQARIWRDLAEGRNLKEANQWLRERLGNEEGYREIGYRFVLWNFGSNTRQFPGRLEKDVEKALKERLFKWLDSPEGRDWGKPKPSDLLRRMLAYEQSFVMYTHNWVTRSDAENYINLQCLKDDPDFRNRKFRVPEGKHPLHRDEPLAQGGDTVLERYEMYNKYFQIGLKQWALHGLFNELASPHYEQKTYWGLFWVRDYVTDPIVQKRIDMFLDLAMMDHQQASLSGVRGGCKSRAKSGGLGSRLDNEMEKWLGEYHQCYLDLPGADIYMAPEPAILLRTLGPTVPVYEIRNRLAQQRGEGPSQLLLSQSMNYIYRTPDYTMGCAVFDPNRKYGPLAMWSGIVLRDKKAVWLDAYTGEKRNVQDKDVMITQCTRGNGYPGDPRVDFTAGWNMVEKNGWVFVDGGEAYVAIKVVKGGYKWAKPDRRRLMLNEKYSPIVFQTGRKTDYESFERFQSEILRARYELTEEKLIYHGPRSAKIEFFLAEDPYRLPTINGKTLDVDLKYNYNSPYMVNEVGSDIVIVRYGDREWKYDFGKNEIRALKD